MKQLLQGDALEVLRTLPSESVQSCITSPPYWGLRDYGIDGQYGLEPTPELYISKMVEVFREVKRVLRSDGTLWLNIGDSYSGYHGNGRVPDDAAPSNKPGYVENMRATTVGISGLKPKDLVGIPWLLAFALRADGWYLRQDIIWAKPNPMPESVTDRCTKSHEYIFLLSKSERYYYDTEAIKEPSVTGDERRPYGSQGAWQMDGRPEEQRHGGELRGNRRDGVDRGDDERGRKVKCAAPQQSFRNKRSVWEIATAPYPEAHFATFPPDLVKPCMLAGTSEKGCCSECGAPWERITERTGAEVFSPNSDYGNGAGRNDGGRSQLIGASAKTLGWQPTCKCYPLPAPYPTKRCVVLDPFAGSGTVGLVVQLNHCDFIGIELNPEYILLAEKRLAQESLQF